MIDTGNGKRLVLAEISTMNPDDGTTEDERHGWHGHHTVVDVTSVVKTVRDNLEAEKRTTTEEFTHSTYSNEDVGVAETIADTIEE